MMELFRYDPSERKNLLAAAKSHWIRTAANVSDLDQLSYSRPMPVTLDAESPFVESYNTVPMCSMGPQHPHYTVDDPELPLPVSIPFGAVEGSTAEAVASPSLDLGTATPAIEHGTVHAKSWTPDDVFREITMGLEIPDIVFHHPEGPASPFPEFEPEDGWPARLLALEASTLWYPDYPITVTLPQFFQPESTTETFVSLGWSPTEWVDVLYGDDFATARFDLTSSIAALEGSFENRDEGDEAELDGDSWEEDDLPLAKRRKIAETEAKQTD